MFGLGEAMLGFLRRQVGLRSDAADANGSLHAKVSLIGANNPESGGTDTLFRYSRRIYDRIDYLKGQTPRAASASARSTSKGTVLNVSGKGFLQSLILEIRASVGGLRIMYLSITIDGTSVLYERSFYQQSNNSYHVLPLGFRFNSNVTVEAYVDDGMNMYANVMSFYSLD